LVAVYHWFIIGLLLVYVIAVCYINHWFICGALLVTLCFLTVCALVAKHKFSGMGPENLQGRCLPRTRSAGGRELVRIGRELVLAEHTSAFQNIFNLAAYLRHT
jgi:hypothetical protein